MPAGYLYHRANDRYLRDPIASLLGEEEREKPCQAPVLQENTVSSAA
jgi:hypothetical protein